MIHLHYLQRIKTRPRIIFFNLTRWKKSFYTFVVDVFVSGHDWDSKNNDRDCVHWQQHHQQLLQVGPEIDISYARNDDGQDSSSLIRKKIIGFISNGNEFRTSKVSIKFRWKRFFSKWFQIKCKTKKNNVHFNVKFGKIFNLHSIKKVFQKKCLTSIDAIVIMPIEAWLMRSGARVNVSRVEPHTWVRQFRL